MAPEDVAIWWNHSSIGISYTICSWTSWVAWIKAWAYWIAKCVWLDFQDLIEPTKGRWCPILAYYSSSLETICYPRSCFFRLSVGSLLARRDTFYLLVCNTSDGSATGVLGPCNQDYSEVWANWFLCLILSEWSTASLTYHEYEFQREFFTALQLIAMSIFMVRTQLWRRLQIFDPFQGVTTYDVLWLGCHAPKLL